MGDVRKVPSGHDDQGNETYDYALGGEVDGVFIPFATLSGSYVDGLVESAKNAESGDQSASGEPATEPAGEPGDAEQ
jgi:hypothetical protein